MYVTVVERLKVAPPKWWRFFAHEWFTHIGSMHQFEIWGECHELSGCHICTGTTRKETIYQPVAANRQILMISPPPGIEHIKKINCFQSCLRFTEKLKGRYRGFQHAPYPHTCIAWSIIYVPYQSGIFIYMRLHSWYYISYDRKFYNDMYLPLQCHCFTALNILYEPPIHLSLFLVISFF